MREIAFAIVFAAAVLGVAWYGVAAERTRMAALAK